MGGVEFITLNLIAQFQEQGIQCSLALAHAHGELLDRARRLTWTQELAPAGMYQFVPRLAGLIHRWKPTHIVVAFADICLLTLWARKWARSKALVVYGVHNTHGWETARPGLWGHLRYIVDRRTARIVYRQVDAIVASSHGVENEIRDLFALGGDKVSTIYNPAISVADMRRISDRAHRAKSAVCRLVAIGRLTRQKGFDILIDALTTLDKQTQWRLEIYGDGPERNALERQVRDDNLIERVAFMGYTDDALGCLMDADLFVLPSRHEGLPTILIQALASGIQIVATDCHQGPREILQDGRFGVLVRPEDARDLARGLNSVLSGTEHFVPALVRSRALDFTVEASAASWQRLLDCLVSH